MDYLGYLQDYFDGYTVTEEANFNYKGGTSFIIKYLGGGQNYLDSVLKPVQIVAQTDDVMAAQLLLATFAQTKSGTMIIKDLEYIRQSYSTPTVLSSFQSAGANHFSQVIVTGTLIISTNLSDITKVEIDGFEYFTTTRSLNYSSVPDTQPDSGRLGTTNINKGILQFICSMENKNNNICVRARRVREGILGIDSSFIIKLTFSDNDIVETYTMKLASYALDSTNLLSPVTTLTFVR